MCEYVWTNQHILEFEKKFENKVYKVDCNTRVHFYFQRINFMPIIERNEFLSEANGRTVSRSWAFTINNPSLADITAVKRWADFGANGVVGSEVGETGTPHLQGQVTFSKPTTFKQVKAINAQAHWSKTRCLARSVEYCKKDGDWWSIGEGYDIRQGKRTDLDVLAATIKEGGIKAAYVSHAGMLIKFPAGCKLISQISTRSIVKMPPCVIWLYGPTGTGKTQFVCDNEQYDETWTSGNELKWFDNYTGQQVALLDDFRGSACKFSWLLRLLDRYPLEVEVKGGFTSWVPLRIYITSCHSPGECYRGVTDENLDQLYRRLHKVINTADYKNLMLDWKQPLWDWIEDPEHITVPYKETVKRDVLPSFNMPL